MKNVTAIGEALIDFIPNEKGVALKSVTGFERVCGGAPANVAAVIAKLGGSSRMITCLGKDAFGDYIVETLDNAGVDTSLVKRTDKANTALAFVSLKADGNRDFSFYRNPSADMLLSRDDIDESEFSDTAILHFCSVDIIEAPVKYAHIKAIEAVKKNSGIISFDPNIRLPLWDSAESCQKTVREFIPYADILKISDEELEFVTGISDENKAIHKLLQTAKVVLYSTGANGAEIITRKCRVKCASPKVTVCDTTGAGDAVIGSFLYCLLKDSVTLEMLSDLGEEKLHEYLRFAVYYASYSVTKKGAIGGYADYAQLMDFMAKN